MSIAETVRLAEHEERIAAAEGLLAELTGLAEELRADIDALAGPDSNLPYRPVASPRLWLADQSARDEVTARLAAWVEQVYIPLYGHEAGRLPACWRQHPFCLLMLDSLAELWACLYLVARTPAIVSGQAEWQTRILPAAAEGMAAEAARCAHSLGGRRTA